MSFNKILLIIIFVFACIPAFSAEEAAPAAKAARRIAVDFAGGQTGGDNIMPGSEDTRERMSNAFLEPGVKFVGNIEGREAANPWILPNKIEGSNPAKAFFDANTVVLSVEYYVRRKDGYKGAWHKADLGFAAKAGQIAERKKELGPVSYVFFDYGDIAMPRGSYYDNLAKILLGEDAQNAAGEEDNKVVVTALDKNSTILFVPSPAAAVALKDYGFHVAVLEANIPTPEALVFLADSAALAVDNMAEAKKFEAAKQQVAKTIEEVKETDKKKSK